MDYFTFTSLSLHNQRFALCRQAVGGRQRRSDESGLSTARARIGTARAILGAVRARLGAVRARLAFGGFAAGKIFKLCSKITYGGSTLLVPL